VNYNLHALFILLLILVSPVAAAPLDETNPLNGTNAGAPVSGPFTITLFIPSSNMIHSDQILDMINTPAGDVLFGTSFGLSHYNGTWSTRHINRDNISQGLMDEYIKAIEYDPEGNLWIGYSGGIQIYNGVWYQTLRDQQLFKDPRIQDIQRWNEDMWVATGHSGIHRYRDGVWQWFQPMTSGGPGFYEVREMVLDPTGNTLIIVTADNGLWMVGSADDPVVFEQIAPKGGSFGLITNVKRDPLGGVYFYNDTSVVHYSPHAGFVPVLTAKDLTQAEIEINDLAAATDGALYLGTDDGIFIWRDGGLYRSVGRFEGIGTSEVVRTVSIDSKNRVWFATKGFVGFYVERSETQNPIRIEMVTPVPEPFSVTSDETPAILTAVTIPSESDSGPGTRTGGLAPILDPILRALDTVLSKLGIMPG